MILFFDSSALAKRYVRETGTGVVLDLVRRAERLFASRLTWLEVTSAVTRAARERQITNADEIIRALDDDFAVLINILEVTPTVISDARSLARRHGLRAGDAMQLASALYAIAKAEWSEQLVFVSSDNELNRAAEKERLTVLNPLNA